MKTIKEIIAENLTALRLQKNYTQSELAEKLNYTDKSVSKWEHGETTPPIEVLKSLADIYGVTVDYLITESGEYSFDKLYSSKKNQPNKIWITLLAVSLIWLIATISFVYAFILYQISLWQAFVIAVPLSSIVLLVFNGIWGKRKFIFIITSVLVWSVLASIFVCTLSFTPWPIFILGIPLQIAIILWSMMKTNKK